MMQDAKKLGKAGEAASAAFLINKGYRLLGQNYLKRYGEIDIIMRSPDGVLVFVEVKTMMRQFKGLKPEDQVSVAKLTKMRRMAQAYWSSHPQLVSDDLGWRIDVVTVEVHEGAARATIRHYQNVA